MQNRFQKIFLAILLLSYNYSAIAEQSTSEKVIGYSGVGKIRWLIPNDLDYYLAVPHWTSGPRIKCKESSRESCEISVFARDTEIPNEDRVNGFFSKFDAVAKESVEKSLKIQTYGSKNKVFFSTITDAQKKTEYRYLTFGIYAKGTASIQFQYLSNDENGQNRKRFLEMIHSSNPMGSLQIFAWKINDYKMVCESRFPEFQKNNELAWTTSPFSSSDYLDLMGENSKSNIDKIELKSRTEFEKILDQSSFADQKDFCKNLPDRISRAQKTLDELK